MAGPPAARITDTHVCGLVTGVVPHVGGPIVSPAAPTVLIGKLPAAGMGSVAICVGPPDSVVKGSATVLVSKKPLARMGDTCAHGGTIVMGCPTVLVGG
ncbi:MAG: PAAR domain-containing protein [Pseudomonadota bacterium]